MRKKRKKVQVRQFAEKHFEYLSLELRNNEIIQSLKDKARKNIFVMKSKYSIV
jgi:hypothetical protein